MGGSAILGDNLVDDLIPDVIDGIRADLHPTLGVRQFRVFTVVRTYTGSVIGEGDFTEVETELVPQPLVQPYKTRLQLEDCGIDEAGFIVLREISLTYTEAEVSGPPSDPDTEDFLIKITDAHGQAIPDTFWHLVARPYPDRLKDMGWTMKLEPASTPEPA